MITYQETTCIEDLIEQYEETLDRTKKRIEELEENIEPFKKVFDDEKLAKSTRIEVKENAKEFLHDLSIFNNIRCELEFSIHWMKTGHQPSNSRGIERRAAYQREKPFDPLLMQRFFRSQENEYSWDHEEKENVIGPSDKERISEALAVLNDKEKEIYLLAKGQSMTYGKIGKLLSIPKSTVANTIYRADKKIGAFVANQRGREEQ